MLGASSPPESHAQLVHPGPSPSPSTPLQASSSKPRASSSNLKLCPFPGCQAAFAKPAHLQRHQLVHDKEQPHACQHCDQKFGRLDSLKRHQGRKHPDKCSPAADTNILISTPTTTPTPAPAPAPASAPADSSSQTLPSPDSSATKRNKRRRLQASQSSRSAASVSSSNDASQLSPHSSATTHTVPWPSRAAFAQPLGDQHTPPGSPPPPPPPAAAAAARPHVFSQPHHYSSSSTGTNEAWADQLGPGGGGPGAGATPAASSSTTTATTTNTSALPPWSEQLHQDLGDAGEGAGGNSLAALASVAQSQLPVGIMSAASNMLVGTAAGAGAAGAAGTSAGVGAGALADAGTSASSALPFHLNSSSWSSASPANIFPDATSEAMMPSIDDILESFLASSAATSFSGSGSGFFLDGANDIFPAAAQSAPSFVPSLNEHAVHTPGTSIAAHTATPPSAPSPAAGTGAGAGAGAASGSLQTCRNPFIRAATSTLGTPRLPFPSSPSHLQHPTTHRASDAHHSSRQGSESAAAEKVASETRDLVIKGVVLPRLPQAASAEEIFWLANSRLPTLAPVIPPAFMQQGVMAKTFPVLYIVVSALGTLWHSDPSVREYGLSLWYFTYLAMWTQSGFLIDDTQATAYGLVVALHAQLFAHLSGDKFAGFRKARLGYNTMRATSRERGWRQLDAPFRLLISSALDSPEQLHYAHEVLQDERATFEARASALRAVEAAWAAWQEREQATRTAIVIAIMDGQNTPYDASLQPDGSNGIEAFDLGASSVNILLQSVVPTFNIDAWAAKTSMEWLKAILARTANAFEQTSSMGLGSDRAQCTQVGQIVDEMLRGRASGQEEVTTSVFARRHTALLELAVLEGLHFAWLGRKHSDAGWVRSMTRAFHPNHTAAGLSSAVHQARHHSASSPAPPASSASSPAAAVPDIPLHDQVHAALARWPNLPFNDTFSSAQSRNSTIDGTLHVHLRWHSVCLEACTGVSEIRAMLQTQQYKRRLRSHEEEPRTMTGSGGMLRSASISNSNGSATAPTGYLQQARIRRGAFHAATILASTFAMPSQQLMHLHISQSVCASTALLLAIALEQGPAPSQPPAAAAGRGSGAGAGAGVGEPAAGGAVAGTGAMHHLDAPHHFDPSSAPELWHVADVQTDRILSDAGWATTLAASAADRWTSSRNKSQQDQPHSQSRPQAQTQTQQAPMRPESGSGSESESRRAYLIRDWINYGDVEGNDDAASAASAASAALRSPPRAAPLLCGTPLRPGETLRNRLKSVVYDVRSLQRPLPSHLAPWLDLFLAVVA